MRTHAVLFDFFGTLTHAVQRGRQHQCIARVLGCDPADFAAVLDRSFDDRCRGAHGSAESSLSWVCRQLGVDPDLVELRAACRARVAAVRADTRLRADAVSALHTVRARGLHTGLVSDCGYELPAFLPRLPIAPLLDTASYSVRVRQCKPHPAMYLTACQALGVTPDACVYIGDGGSTELSGARAVGMTAVRLTAPDLGQHLTFRAERDWNGPTAATLTEAIAFAVR